ncbi:activator-dependent family glycosyltransferase [Streptomyces wuyuanensis]|uniref:activator-dependent family glycosyltransferase n=1 Tax=Streptomyces wuyuanensis TaxID=1196353 RepID=UPI003812C0A7
MRVMFTTFAAKSHLHIQIPLAWALRSAGHDVCVASQPDLVEYITHTGLTAVGVGENLDLDVQMAGANRRRDRTEEVAGDPDFLTHADLSGLDPDRHTYPYLRGAFELMAGHVYPALSSDAMIGDLVDFARHWKPDLVVWDTHTFAGAIAATVTGAAHARLLFGADLLAHSRRTFLRERDLLPAAERSDPLADWLGGILDRYDRPFTEEVVTGRWAVDPVPASMRLPSDQHHVPVRYVPYNGPSVLPDWLSEPVERPRVCLTLGWSGRDVLGADRASVGELLDAVAEVDAEVVATLSAAQLDRSGKVPDNVRVTDFVPLDALLPTCSAVIHQGGAGTFQTAQLHGVPQIIVPDLLWDYGYKMRHVESTGSGLAVHDVDGFTAEQLRSMLVRLLVEPSFARNAAVVRREMLGMPAPRDVVPVLERLTAEYHRSPGTPPAAR